MLNHQEVKYDIKTNSRDALKRSKSLKIQTHPHVPSRTLSRRKALSKACKWFIGSFSLKPEEKKNWREVQLWAQKTDLATHGRQRRMKVNNARHTVIQVEEKAARSCIDVTSIFKYKHSVPLSLTSIDTGLQIKKQEYNFCAS